MKTQYLGLTRFYVMTKQQYDTMLREDKTVPTQYMRGCLLESLALHYMRLLGQWLSQLCVWDIEKSQTVAVLDQHNLRLPYDLQAPPISYYSATTGKLFGTANVQKLSHAYPDPNSCYEKSP